MTETRGTSDFLGRTEAGIALGVPDEAIDRLIRTGLLRRWRGRGGFVYVEAGQVAELATLPREYLLRC